MLTVETKKTKPKKGKPSKLYCRVLAGNKKQLLKSGYYTNKRNMADAIALVKAGLPIAKVVDLA